MGDYGIWAVVPPLVAIILCFVTKRVLVSLFLGIFTGGLIISNGNPLAGMAYSIDKIIISIKDPWNLKLLLFTFFMGSGIAFIWQLGGSKALETWAVKKIDSRKKVGIGAWILGIIVCINDVLNAAVVGNSFRDMSHKFNISSEKLSYVLDSTAAPISALLISDWIAFQIGMIQNGIDIAGITGIGAVQGYLRSIPFNLYSILSVLFVGIIVITGRDYGPMLKAEIRAIKEGKIHRDGASPMLDVGYELGEPKDVKPRLGTFFFPLITVVVVSVLGILWTGRSGTGLMNILENSDAALALLWGAFAMTLVGMLIAFLSKINVEESMDIFLDGFKLMIMTGGILVMAWSIGNVTSDMNLSNYLISLVGEDLALTPLIVVVFLLGMFTAFATGTSWGTMAIMTPMTIPLVYQITANPQISVAMAGVVFSGAIFGDHVSPISDTTVASSIFSGADHMDHVRTQLPYALTVAAVALSMYVLYGIFKLSPVILITLGFIILVGLVFLFSNIHAKNNDFDFKDNKLSIED